MTSKNVMIHMPTQERETTTVGTYRYGGFFLLDGQLHQMSDYGDLYQQQMALVTVVETGYSRQLPFDTEIVPVDVIINVEYRK